MAFVVGCGGKSNKIDSEKWLALVSGLTNNHDRVARLDVPDSRIITSFDPAGSNNDYNNYLRKGPKGWWVIADLKGPGYISRFWFTGAAPEGSHRDQN